MQLVCFVSDFKMVLVPPSVYTISIPAPIIPGELEQLAQIQVPGNKFVVVYWMRSTRQAVCNYDDKWYIQSDQNIMTAVARLIKFEKNIELLTMDGLFTFETRGHGRAADDDLMNGFRDCEWSDYASDRLVFQCVIREKNLVEKNTIDHRTADMERNNRIKYNLETKNKENLIRSSPTPPVLTRATECCCTGCHERPEVTKNKVVDKNHKW